MWRGLNHLRQTPGSPGPFGRSIWPIDLADRHDVVHRAPRNRFLGHAQVNTAGLVLGCGAGVDVDSRNCGPVVRGRDHRLVKLGQDVGEAGQQVAGDLMHLGLRGAYVGGPPRRGIGQPAIEVGQCRAVDHGYRCASGAKPALPQRGLVRGWRGGRGARGDRGSSGQGHGRSGRKGECPDYRRCFSASNHDQVRPHTPNRALWGNLDPFRHPAVGSPR